MLILRNFLPRAPIRVLAGAAFLVSATYPVAAKAEECVADWGLAGEIVRREKLMTVGELSKSAAADKAGEIVKTTLCKDGDDYVYKLVVRDAKGQLKAVVVDARAKGNAAAPR